MSRREQLYRAELERRRLLEDEERLAAKRAREIALEEARLLAAVERELMGDTEEAWRQVHTSAGRGPRKGHDEGKRGTRA